ncbi:MAG: glycosyltransferase [Alphaproteobacteria bacterium]
MRLAVVVEDRIGEIAAKGELLDGYFNPAAAFSQVTVVSLFESSVPAVALARLCAPARAVALAAGLDRATLLARTAGMRPRRLAHALRPVAEAAAQTVPDLVRAYGDGLAVVAAAAIAGRAGVPFVASLHTTPDPRARTRLRPWRDRLWRHLLRPAADKALASAAGLMPVYSPILDYLPPSLRARATVLPNVVGVTSRPAARPGRRDGRLRVLWAGRLIPGRDPRPLIASLAHVPQVDLTLVGDGPLRGPARVLAEHLGLTDRVRFVAALGNPQFCAALGQYDVLAAHTLYREMPKTVMEAALAGLPLVINRDPSATVAEYAGLPVVWVDETAESYGHALARLAAAPTECLDLGAGMADQAWTRWNPSRIADATADYMLGMAGRQGGAGV